ncbi:hypothetical protein EHZ47_00240 [Aeromonas jandaei]|uniref:putative phage abortive infection protein n=1 Tax=Aeromonas jandaei TaxID=650 RepID=UPI000F525D41|nr:putative phage abortive infection protein [Aeromonas jandaei]RQM78576.1 hypothetical protein EHZ47_00240 [Aeromonas jandaei]
MKNVKTIWLIAIIIIAAWLYYPMLIGHQISLTKVDIKGANEFGDLYGALNTLFSGFAFLGIIASIFIQSEELNDTRREIAKQTEQFKSQTDALNKQNFENTYFKLLSLNNEILKLVSVDYTTTEFGERNNYSGQGRDAFKKLSEAFKTYRRVHSQYSIGFCFELFHRDVEDVLGHYFRAVYQCLKLIDGSLLCHYQKKEYANMLRAQMSKYELELLFYNCISKLGCDKFRPLLEKYEFFEHLSSDFNINKEHLLYYEISVFGFSNRKYFERYLGAVALKAINEHKKVYCYLESNGFISKVNVRKSENDSFCDDDDTIDIRRIEMLLSKRMVIWVEMEE